MAALCHETSNFWLVNSDGTHLFSILYYICGLLKYKIIEFSYQVNYQNQNLWELSKTHSTSKLTSFICSFYYLGLSRSCGHVQEPFHIEEVSPLTTKTSCGHVVEPFDNEVSLLSIQCVLLEDFVSERYLPISLRFQEARGSSIWDSSSFRVSQSIIFTVSIEQTLSYSLVSDMECGLFIYYSIAFLSNPPISCQSLFIMAFRIDFYRNQDHYFKQTSCLSLKRYSISLYSQIQTDAPFLQNFIRSFYSFFTGIKQGMCPSLFQMRLPNKYTTTKRSRKPAKSFGIQIYEKYSIWTQTNQKVEQFQWAASSIIFFLRGAVTCSVYTLVFRFITSSIGLLSFLLSFSLIIGLPTGTFSVYFQQLKQEIRLSQRAKQKCQSMQFIYFLKCQIGILTNMYFFESRLLLVQTIYQPSEEKLILYPFQKNSCFIFPQGTFENEKVLTHKECKFITNKYLQNE